MALDARFGEPVDTYVNGSQVWLRDTGPGGIALEWRLHPVAGYRRPAGVATEEVFSSATLALAAGEAVDLGALWDGLEAFPAYGDPTEPGELRAAVTADLGLAPDASGLVDHEVIGDAWERARGSLSVADALFAQLRGPSEG